MDIKEHVPWIVWRLIMATVGRPQSTTLADVNGAAMAAMLAAGIGAFAMAQFVILNEAGLFAAPTLYGPAGGVTGRTTFATLVWLAAWALLHTRWRARDMAPGRVFGLTLALIGGGILGTSPPLWGLL
jgi:hypothetical protein